MRFFEKYDSCKNGKDCAHFKEKGRAAYLMDKEARLSGLCKPCREAGLEFSIHADVSPDSSAIHNQLPSSEVLLSHHDLGGLEATSAKKDRSEIGLAFEQEKPAGNHGYQTAGFSPHEEAGALARLEHRLQEAAIGRDEGALKLDIDADGKEEVFTTQAEMAAQRKFAGSAFNPTQQAEDTVRGWMDLSYEPADFNADLKQQLTHNLSEEAQQLLADSLTQVIPSKTSPVPVFQVDRSASDKEGSVRNSQLFFLATYQGANFLMNGQRFAWADEAFPCYSFSMEIMSGSKAGEVIPQLHPEAPKSHDYNCSALVSREECEKIFGGVSPEQVALRLSRLSRLWGSAPIGYLTSRSEVSSLIGSEHLPKEVAHSPAHYSNAIGVGLDSLSAYKTHQRSPVSQVGRNFAHYLEESVADRFSSEEEAFAFLMSNPDELDDFLFSEKALDWLMAKRKEQMGEGQMPSEAMLAEIRDAQQKVVAFTNLIDKKWGEAYEKEGKEALKARFGHPVGLPDRMLSPHHFLPGGYLVEGGWLKLNDGKDFSLTINFPVDKNGRPDPSTAAWEKLSPLASLRKEAGALARLGDLAEACATASEAWQVAYNRGLPRDSLYGAAQLSLIDPNINGASQDDFSGTVRGLYHPHLKGIELALGSQMRYFPTTSSKLSALSRSLATKNAAQLCPRGVLSLEEIDLSNWRLSRLADNQCGNEYGMNSVKEGEAAPFNFTRLGRDYHEQIQKKIRSFGKEDGLVTFVQPEEDFVRPLVGRQRGEAMRCFVEKPGSYLRRTGFSGLRKGAPKAVYEHIKAPLAPWSAFRDPALGFTTDLTTAANNAPGHQSLNPYAFVSVASGCLRTAGISEVESMSYNKFMTTGPGRRGENLPRRLRFAARSLGERAAASGLIYPEVIEEGSEDARMSSFPNIHPHVAEEGYQTEDSPRFAEDLLSAPWHNPLLYIKDFELGEMGDSYKKLGGSEEERRSVLQMLLAAKQSVREELFSPARQLLSVVQRNYTFPADPTVTYGHLGSTGPTIIKYGTAPEVRRQGLTRGVRISLRSMATFGAYINSLSYKETREARKGEEFSSAEPFLLASRSGQGASGLENTPIRYGDTPPIKAADRIRRWSNDVIAEGKAGSYELAEFDWQEDSSRSTFEKMTEKLLSQLSEERKRNAEVLIADSAFIHQTSKSGDGEVQWNISLTQAADDEAALRAAQDSEKNKRQDIAKAGARAIIDLGRDDSEYAKYFQALLSSLRRRGRKVT